MLRGARTLELLVSGLRAYRAFLEELNRSDPDPWVTEQIAAADAVLPGLAAMALMAGLDEEVARQFDLPFLPEVTQSPN
jgi:hypothetical protein